MKKYALMLLFPALPCLAQENGHPESKTPMVERSLYKEEYRKLSLNMQSRFSPTALNTIRVPDPGLAAKTNSLLEGRDYFPARLFADNALHASEQSGPHHDFNTHHYPDVSLMIDGKQYEQLDAYEINDRYTIHSKPGTELEFKYDNTYFLFKDASGHEIATVYYIERTVGSLKSEYKIVQKATASKVAALLVTPNPADHNISITYDLEQGGICTLRIVDLNGRTVQTMLNSQPVAPGRHVSALTINLPPGQYMVSLDIHDSAPVVQKLIIK